MTVRQSAAGGGRASRRNDDSVVYGVSQRDITQELLIRVAVYPAAGSKNFVAFRVLICGNEDPGGCGDFEVPVETQLERASAAVVCARLPRWKRYADLADKDRRVWNVFSVSPRSEATWCAYAVRTRLRPKMGRMRRGSGPRNGTVPPSTRAK